ncbi:MAG: hypothetical protein QM661_03250 [Solimonas sp.]
MYRIWGLFPLYWRLLHAVPATQIMAHRIVWSSAFVTVWLAAREGWAWLRTLTPRRLAMFAYGARRIPLGIIGVLPFHEPFGGARALGFYAIWAALFVFALDGSCAAGAASPLPEEPCDGGFP